MYVGNRELHFCSPTLNTEISQYKKTVSLCKTPLFYITPIHTLPLFCPTPCMLTPYSVPPNAYNPPSLSHPMHALPLFYPAHACPPPILSHPMHTLPLFYPTPCMPSPYSIPPYACPPPILSHLMHALPLFYPKPCIPCPLFYPSSCTPSPYSIPAYTPSPYSIPPNTCPPLILFHCMHILSSPTSPHMTLQDSITAHACPPNSLSHEPGRHVSPLTSENAAFESAHTEYIIIIYIA